MRAPELSLEMSTDKLFLSLNRARVRRVTAASAQSLSQRESGEVPERHSIAYFVGPDADALLYAQPSRTIADQCMRDEPVVFQTCSTKLFNAARK